MMRVLRAVVWSVLMVPGLVHGQLLQSAVAAAGGETVLDAAGDHTALGASEIRASLVFGDGMETTAPWVADTGKKRSIPLAFGLSAILPGAGQGYNGQWKKAAVAIGLEVAVLAIWSSSRTSGLDAEDAFRDFAHARWSPAQYGTWLNDYVSYLAGEFGHTVSASAAVVPTSVDFTNPSGWSAADRSVVDAYFAQIQAIERQVYHPETGASFSHQIPGFAEQQYYELIGKYFQFAPGWDDYPSWTTADGSFTGAIDPEQTGQGGSKPNVSPTFYEYASDHAHAQDLLRTASRLSTLFVVNHLAAGIDAAITAKLRSDRVSTQVRFMQDPGGPPVPSLTLRVGL